MRLIDADELANCKFHGWPNVEITPSDVNAEAYKRGWNDVVDAIIEDAPTVDAVEVVRCENCKHYKFGNYGTYPYINGTCTYHDRGAYPKCYCNFGEKKNDE